MHSFEGFEFQLSVYINFSVSVFTVHVSVYVYDIKSQY